MNFQLYYINLFSVSLIGYDRITKIYHSIKIKQNKQEKALLTSLSVEISLSLKSLCFSLIFILMFYEFELLIFKHFACKKLKFKAN